MSIHTITAEKVTCQQCDNTIIVEQWRDAAKHGWAVPTDGGLQLCPLCLDVHKAGLIARAIAVWKNTETEIVDLLDTLEFAEGALLDAFNSEDGLDGEAAREVAIMCSDLLIKHGRVSVYVEAGKGPEI